MSQNDQSKVPGGADLIIPVAAGAYAIYYVYSVWDFPFEAQISGLALAGLVCALVLAYFARTALDVLRGRQSLGFGSLSDSRKLRSAGVVFLLTVGYIVAGDRKNVVMGKSVSGRGDLGGGRILKKKN